MAKIFPAGWNHMAVTGAALREIETLEMLRADLPDRYSVYHGVHWTRLRSGFSIFGEVDFIVVSPSGCLMVIEQKSGFFEETPNGLFKIYSNQRKSVGVQIARTVSNLYSRMSTAFGTGNFKIEELLYCPDYTVRDPSIAGVNPSRIVDATRRSNLAAMIERVLPEDEMPLPCAGKLHAFLADELSLLPDVAAMIDESSKLTTRISDGPATWARNIEFDPFRLRVTGTAGSGKTQLAVGVMQDAMAAAKRTLYVCYNRPLAEHLRTVVPSGVTVMSYHQLCVSLLKPQGISFDFTQPDAFSRLEAAFAHCELPGHVQYDVLVVDEGQDFQQTWVEARQRQLGSGARWWRLEDPMQNLYSRAPLTLTGWVEVRMSLNYRTPRDILRTLERISGGKLKSDAASPFDDSEIGAFSYANATAAHATQEAVSAARAAGFRLNDIVVLSFKGREKSALASLDRLGEYRLSSFTGTYDRDGQPIYRDGDLLFESVYRFKEQCAPCIILAEIDFDTLDEAVLRRLFVGATRATMKLVLVMSERAAREVTARI
ncbi:nuclease [Paraburkholderia phytofirmans OLGA172]|uniref:Nuclease n=1 Tax=Paraburkholderia phytofirmans OLGA172 TaxID=1417228 RepID=A0A167WC94_9BURK|nr:NERD domain-containing protein/DEAD/DEAH box helicase [Paraburkholderia phytofirmans]ANB75673.1 nuclease [Paraburkholderia phytofirmans OLGA172]